MIGVRPYPPERQAWYAVGVLGGALAFALLDQNIVGLLIQQIKRDLTLTDAEAGLLLGPAFVIFYAFLGLPLSRYADRSKRTFIVSAGIFVWSLATAFCGLAVGFVPLFVARIFVGAGEAVNGPASYSIVADYFPRERLPRAVAVMQLGSVAGSGLSLLIGGAMIWIVTQVAFPGGFRPWQMVFIAVGLPGLIVSALMLTVKEPPRRGVPTEAARIGFRDTARYLFGRFPLYAPIFFGLALGSLDAGGKAWGAAFFERTYGWSPARYGLISGMMAVILMLIGLYLGTRLVEAMLRRGREDASMRVLIYSRIVALPALIAMPLMPNPWLALACSAVQMVTIGISGPSINTMLQIITPNRIRGQVTALYLFIYTVFGAGLSPLMTGLVTDYVFTSPADLRWSILLLHLVFLPPALIVTWLGWKPYREAVRRLNEAEAS
jgi:MFS family permease